MKQKKNLRQCDTQSGHNPKTIVVNIIRADVAVVGDVARVVIVIIVRRTQPPVTAIACTAGFITTVS